MRRKQRASRSVLFFLLQLCLFDEEFEKRLEANARLQSVFEKIAGPGEHTSLLDRDQEEVECIAMLYIENALLNRARFVCMQKYKFLGCCIDGVLSESTKQTAETAINAEMIYVTKLVRRFETPDMLHAKQRLSHWLNFILPADPNPLGDLLSGGAQLVHPDYDEV